VGVVGLLRQQERETERGLHVGPSLRKGVVLSGGLEGDVPRGGGGSATSAIKA